MSKPVRPPIINLEIGQMNTSKPHMTWTEDHANMAKLPRALGDHTIAPSNRSAAQGTQAASGLEPKFIKKR